MDKLDIIRQEYGRLQVLEEPDQKLGQAQRIRAVVRPLLSWYATHARVLPWRENPDGYRVWISEIMLQQTRVEAVKPYYERFLAALPGIAQLAVVDDDQLMKLWEGLGYYNRARNLKKAAQMVEEEYGGKLPPDYQELLKLPGIGSYTAGAIASIAYGQAVPAVDGNVLRVLSRVLASEEDVLKPQTKKRFEELLREVMPKKWEFGQNAPGAFNQALMEIGATVCVPNGKPHCEECPLNSLCLARRYDLTGQIPVKTPPKKRRLEEHTVCILETEDRKGLIAIKKRPPEGLLASLYELPNLDGHLKPQELPQALGVAPGQITAIERLPDAKHIFSHVEWRMIGYRVRICGNFPTDFLPVERKKLKEVYPLPNAFSAYAKLV